MVNKDYGKIKICKDCDNMNRYVSDEEGFFICDICGKADSHKNWIGGLSRDNICFSCDFWVKCVKEYKKGNKIVINRNCYTVDDENKKGFKGFDGRKFKIRMLNGSEFETSNLWHNGKVPERFNSYLQDNATFI
jgi:hypothetical protein